MKLNGYTVKPAQAEIVEAVLALAAGEMAEDAFAEWLRERLEPLA